MPKTTTKPPATVQDFPMVGVGASAGGLDAFKNFLQAIPEKSGMAFVLVQHLDPSHDSILPEILQRVTKVKVLEITDKIHLAPNHIYVIVEDKILTSTDGILKLGPRNAIKTNLAIDVFFISLAEIHQELAVGVLLSGFGSDGTLGLKAIKEHGGITFAQDEESAHYGDMPQNAINAQTVDFILPPQEIPAKIIDVLSKSDDDEEKQDDHQYNEIIEILRHHSGVDFSSYKQSTIRRRISRRMSITKSENFTDYLQLLRQEQSAPGILFNDLLIPVTSFFRDPKIFLTVRDIVFTALENSQEEYGSIRIWVAGCSTGEEAFTLAILLHEFLGKNPKGIKIQIFASDISESAIAKARIGFYNKSQLINVSDVNLKKYFLKTSNGYQINRLIRDTCVFAIHNFLKDPPFAKIDLITCRNVLIYMKNDLQKKALTTFHYALKTGGYLLLGKSETTGLAAELFLPVDKSAKIFSRKSVPHNFMHLAGEKKLALKNIGDKNAVKPEALKPDFRKSAESTLLADYTPASVIINKHMDIVHFQGMIAPFLQQPEGKPSFNLLKMAREGLAFELRNSVHKVTESGSKNIKEAIPLLINDKIIDVTIEVVPLADTSEPYFLILFYETPVLREIYGSHLSADEKYSNENLKRISQLEKELAQIQVDVNIITEDQEASNEELQSANEELLSGSEELQSLNEELETYKEELQSSNEELITINQELHEKQDIINVSKDYTEAIIATLREPIVVLDTELHIRNINNAFAKKFNVTKEGVEGRLLYQIQNHLFDNAFMRTILEKVIPQKIQINDYQISVNLLPFGNSTMLLNARQVTNEKSREQLILLAIEDITERKLNEERLQQFTEELENTVQERTADLQHSNNELETSVKDLNNANIQLQQFAYIASHDLQEPLRKILMFISRLQEKMLTYPEDITELLDKISTSSFRMRTLIKDLLDYSYLNKVEIPFVETDLNKIIDNILTDFELLVEEKNVTIQVAKMPIISAIPSQINQLFYNLFSNSLKFSTEKEPKIIITAKKVTVNQLQKFKTLNQELKYCEIIFCDNGIGFEQQYESKIFTIFQKLHNNDQFKGTGIGLAITKRIVENHHGTVFAISKPNEGAAFHIILPCTRH